MEMLQDISEPVKTTQETPAVENAKSANTSRNSKAGFKRLFKFAGFKLILNRDKSKSETDQHQYESCEIKTIQESEDIEQIPVHETAAAHLSADPVIHAAAEEIIAIAESILNPPPETQAEVESNVNLETPPSLTTVLKPGMVSGLRKKENDNAPEVTTTETGQRETEGKSECATDGTTTVEAKREGHEDAPLLQVIKMDLTKETSAVLEELKSKNEIVLHMVDVEDVPRPAMLNETEEETDYFENADDQFEEAHVEDASSEEEYYSMSFEAEILASLEKKIQVPLKMLFTRTCLKTFSAKRHKHDVDEQTELVEHAADKMSLSSESEEVQCLEDLVLSPELVEHLTEKGDQIDSVAEKGKDDPCYGDKNKGRLQAWDSFKKYISPKKYTVKHSESKHPADNTPADKAVPTKINEKKPELNITHQPRKKADLSVSWEDFICLKYPKKRDSKGSVAKEELESCIGGNDTKLSTNNKSPEEESSFSLRNLIPGLWEKKYVKELDQMSSDYDGLGEAHCEISECISKPKPSLVLEAEMQALEKVVTPQLPYMEGQIVKAILELAPPEQLQGENLSSKTYDNITSVLMETEIQQTQPILQEVLDMVNMIPGLLFATEQPEDLFSSVCSAEKDNNILVTDEKSDNTSNCTKLDSQSIASEEESTTKGNTTEAMSEVLRDSDKHPENEVGKVDRYKVMAKTDKISTKLQMTKNDLTKGLEILFNDGQGPLLCSPKCEADGLDSSANVILMSIKMSEVGGKKQESTDEQAATSKNQTISTVCERVEKSEDGADGATPWITTREIHSSNKEQEEIKIIDVLGVEGVKEKSGNEATPEDDLYVVLEQSSEQAQSEEWTDTGTMQDKPQSVPGNVCKTKTYVIVVEGIEKIKDELSQTQAKRDDQEEHVDSDIQYQQLDDTEKPNEADEDPAAEKREIQGLQLDTKV